MSQRTQAFVNLFAAIGTLQKFAEFDEKAAAIAKQQDIIVRFVVRNGPDGLVVFKNGAITVKPYDGMDENIKLICLSPENFNAVVDGKGMPIPIKGILKTLKFMGKPESPFNVLTAEMTSIMRDQKRLDGTAEKELSTKLAFYAMAAAIAQIGNEDEVGKVAGARIPDGEISLKIEGVAEATIIKANGKLRCVPEASRHPRAFMTFDSLDTAEGIINGRLDAMTCVGTGALSMSGFIPMLDNLNKVLNLVPKYLS